MVLKNFWENRQNWQKGALIGFLIGFVLTSIFRIGFSSPSFFLSGTLIEVGFLTFVGATFGFFIGKSKKWITFFIFALLFSLVLLAQYTGGLENFTGFDILLYEPFDFAAPILALIIFSATNKVLYFKNEYGFKSWMKLLGVSISITFLWFFVTLLAVFQLHSMLGGTL